MHVLIKCLSFLLQDKAFFSGSLLVFEPGDFFSGFDFIPFCLGPKFSLDVSTAEKIASDLLLQDPYEAER